MKQGLHIYSFLLVSLPNQLSQDTLLDLLSLPLECSIEDIPYKLLQGGLLKGWPSKETALQTAMEDP